ncbi:Protein of unknown function [Gryllus bimaculatus]|nr:Protein of unknown function [Gryllus bimaculatus]
MVKNKVCVLRWVQSFESQSVHSGLRRRAKQLAIGSSCFHTQLGSALEASSLITEQTVEYECASGVSSCTAGVRGHPPTPPPPATSSAAPRRAVIRCHGFLGAGHFGLEIKDPVGGTAV